MTPKCGIHIQDPGGPITSCTGRCPSWLLHTQKYKNVAVFLLGFADILPLPLLLLTELPLWGYLLLPNIYPGPPGPDPARSSPPTPMCPQGASGPARIPVWYVTHRMLLKSTHASGFQWLRPCDVKSSHHGSIEN